MSPACASSSHDSPRTPDVYASEPDVGPITPQKEIVTHALAIKVDEECLDRWGEVIYDFLHPGERAKKTTEEFREELSWRRLMTVQHMAYKAYCKFPNLPRLERPALLVPCPKLTWLFVFKDNSTHECLHAQVDPADIEAVQEFFGVKKQSAKWYNVSGHV